jgi:hypothetical protein
MAVQIAQPGAALPGPADTAPAGDQLADQAAPLDAFLVDAALDTFRRFAPDDARRTLSSHVNLSRIHSRADSTVVL